MMSAMIGGLQRLLDHLADDNDSWSATTFDLLPAEQRERWTAANDTATEPDESLVYEAFLAQAARAPDAPALLSVAGSMTYGELAIRAASAAAWLRDRRAGPDELVGLIMHRGPEQIVAIMATVLAGARREGAPSSEQCELGAAGRDPSPPTGRYPAVQCGRFPAASRRERG